MTTVVEVSAVVGEAGLQALIAWRPGKRFRVPRDPTILAPIIGMQASAALSRELPHKVLRIPVSKGRIDVDEAFTLLLRGRTPKEVAGILGFHRRAIERLRRKKESKLTSALGAGGRRLLTPNEAASYLGISILELWRLRVAGKLRSIRLGEKSFRYFRAECLRLKRQLNEGGDLK